MGLTCSHRIRLRAGAPATGALGVLCARALMVAAATLVGAPIWAADDFPPPLSTAPDRPGAPAAAAVPAPAAPPSAEQPGAPAEPMPAKAQADVQIEQKRIGRRVAEVIVTPAGFTYRYSMIHLDDQDAGTTPLNPHQELSVPRFFRIDF
jgi:hypothetical protein